MTNTSISAAIVRHIEELEVAFRHVGNVMDPLLGKEAAKLIERKRKEFGWVGEVSDNLDPASWLAPGEWRMAGDTDDNFDLYIDFEGTDCIDGDAPETWVAQFLGFAGAGMQLLLDTNALGRAKWKALLRSQGELIDQLVSKGFRCDARDGVLAMPVLIHKDALIGAFEEQDFEAALAPISAALDRIRAEKQMLDMLVDAIRSKT